MLVVHGKPSDFAFEGVEDAGWVTGEWLEGIVEGVGVDDARVALAYKVGGTKDLMIRRASSGMTSTRF